MREQRGEEELATQRAHRGDVRSFAIGTRDRARDGPGAPPTTRNVTQRDPPERTAGPRAANIASPPHPDKEIAMKPWIRRSLIGLAAVTALVGTVAAFSHRHWHGHDWHAMSEEDAARIKARLIEKAGRKLELDDAQKARLGVLADKLREQRNALVGGTPDPRAELQALIGGPIFDRERATRLLQDKTGALQARSPEVIAALADFYDSLRPEQQAEVRAWLERGRHGHRP
jgi:Spy/CpxP family protein refolding chaperone